MSKIIQMKESGDVNVFPRGVPLSWTYSSSVTVQTKLQEAVENGTIPLSETAMLRIVYGSFYWGICSFYRGGSNNALYGSGIFGTVGKVFVLSCSAGTWTTTNLVG